MLCSFLVPNPASCFIYFLFLIKLQTALIKAIKRVPVIPIKERIITPTTIYLLSGIAPARAIEAKNKEILSGIATNFHLPKINQIGIVVIGNNVRLTK